MKIACVLGPRFEDSEFKDPYDAFRKAGHEVTIVGLEAGAELDGDKGKVNAKVDHAFRDVKAGDFDALLIPGGSSPDKLRAHEEPVSFVKSFMESGKPVFAICHGPQLLLTADEFKNHQTSKSMSGYWTDLKKAGANVVDQEVVVDRNLVTSRQPSDIPAFIRASLKVMEQVPARR